MAPSDSIAKTVFVYAHGFATTFRLRELVGLFSSTARVEKDQLRAQFGEGYALAYDFGALVFVGMELPERERILSDLNRQLPKEPHPPLTEDFIIEVQPNATGEVRFDRVIVPELTLPLVDTIALVLAQSVAVDYYAEDVTELEEEIGRIVDRLRLRGTTGGSVRSLVKFIGRCMDLRNAVISTLALFDKPDATWENEQLDRLWQGLHHMLELDDRSRVLEAKLRMLQDNMVVLVDMARQRRSVTLEFTVVVLILLEILIMIWQLKSAAPSS